jgi:hypothetical protein
MSTGIGMPPIFTPPIKGRVQKIHRMPGHFVRHGDPIVDLQLEGGPHLLTLCAPEDGKIMRCRDIGYIVSAGELVTELTGVGKPTWELFVSYRRRDALGHAGRVGDALIDYYGHGQVFKDLESLEPGEDFVDVLRDRLQRAYCMVVIIGPGWASDERLHEADDLHREEIRTALERKIQIIPVLVHGATMPKGGELPEDIRPLARRQAVEITDSRWDFDVSRVTKKIDEVLAASPRRLRFLAQVPPWDYKGGWQFIADDPPEEW